MDPISNMFTKIRNAAAVKKEAVEIPFSYVKYEIAKILKENGFVKEVDKRGRGTKKVIKVVLNYKEGEPVISGIKRVSKPGQRIYKGTREIRPVKSGYGLAIISTPKGLMTDKQAKKAKVGGEIICEVW
ncbi:MAG TPA: 30S ribosomal protein S8 [Candidatus Parcubacteria bacterium]|nr:30S ribosomal protein S8 [Candidatus Parcubacteria bacterium]